MLAAYLVAHEGFALEQALAWLRANYGGRPLEGQLTALRGWLAEGDHSQVDDHRSRVRGCVLGGAIGDARSAAALPGDLLGDVELRRTLVTLADDLVNVSTLSPDEHHAERWDRYFGS